MNKKKIIVVIIALLVVVIGVIAFIFLKKETPKPVKKVSEETQAVNDVKKFNDMLTGDKTKDELNKYVGKEINESDILTGKDSFTRLQLTEEEKDGKDFSAYEKASDKYSKNIEKHIVNNFKYGIINHSTDPDGNIGITIKFKSYYYFLYTLDLGKIQYELLLMDGYTADKLDSKSKKIAQDSYKAKIKAMEIMDAYIADYINQDEYITYTLVYRNGEKPQRDYYSYMLNFKGHTYKNSNLGAADFSVAQETRTKRYIDSALSNGTLDKNSPLNLK